MWSWRSWWSWWNECSWCEVDVKLMWKWRKVWQWPGHMHNLGTTLDGATPPGLQRQSPRQWHRDQPAGQKHLHLRSNNVEQCGTMWDNVEQCGTMWDNVGMDMSMPLEKVRCIMIHHEIRSHNCFKIISKANSLHKSPAVSSCENLTLCSAWSLHWKRSPGCKPRKALDRVVDRVVGYHRTAIQNKYK